MAPNLIVSYDGTVNDDDALALGKLLANSGATLALAYVRHAREFDPRREELAQHDAERRLEQGASWLGDSSTPQHVVVSASTGEGLEQLAAAERAAVIVFGSDYRTPPGRAEPGNTAQHLLERGSVALAVATAGLRGDDSAAISKIAVVAGDGDDSAERTAAGLAEKLGASVASPEENGIDLIVVGSAPGTPDGRIGLAGPARSLLSGLRSSVLIVPRNQPIAF